MLDHGLGAEFVERLEIHGSDLCLARTEWTPTPQRLKPLRVGWLFGTAEACPDEPQLPRSF